MQPTPPAVEQQAPADKAPSWVVGYGGVVAVCVVIWAITSLTSGHWIYPWPVWMLIPLLWGVVGQMTGRQSRRDRRPRR